MTPEIADFFRPGIANREYYVHDFWERPDIQSIFPGINFENLKQGLNPRTYQSWLDCYFQLIAKNYHASGLWAVQRELITDNFGRPALIERLMDDGGKLQRLGVLRALRSSGSSEAGGAFLYRHEQRFSRREFATTDYVTQLRNLDLHGLFKSDEPISESLDIYS